MPSYEFTLDPLNADELGELDLGEEYPDVDLEDEGVAEQVDAALAAAQSLVDSGVFGNDDNNYRVSVAGVSNADHVSPAVGVNDSVVVSVSQVSDDPYAPENVDEQDEPS